MTNPQGPQPGMVYLERGQPVTIILRWGPGGGPRNVTIRRADGTITVRVGHPGHRPPHRRRVSRSWRARLRRERPVTRPHPPDQRLNGPVNSEWFDPLFFATGQVIPRTLMQSMPVEWQQRMVACLTELRDAFTHVKQPGAYQVTPGRMVAYNSLSDDEIQRLGLTRRAATDVPFWEEPVVYVDRDGVENHPWTRIFVPDDTREVPHYDRGRTYIPPRGPAGDLL